MSTHLGMRCFDRSSLCAILELCAPTPQQEPRPSPDKEVELIREEVAEMRQHLVDLEGKVEGDTA